MTDLILDFCGQPLLLSEAEFRAALERGKRLLAPQAAEARTETCGLVDARELAAVMNLPRTWLAEAARQGRVPSIRVGRYRRFDIAAVRAALQAGSEGA